jgi:signal transduction histidine kinase
VSCVVPDSGTVRVEGDEDLLQRAIFNLALNAVQASPDRGNVRIEVSRGTVEPLPIGLAFEGEAVSLRVIDDGPGIPPEIRDRMFDPFFTTKANGSGLGLAVVHRAIEAHRGHIFVDSSGQGTRFTVILPRGKETSAPPPVVTPSEPTIAAAEATQATPAGVTEPTMHGAARA